MGLNLLPQDRSRAGAITTPSGAVPPSQPPGVTAGTPATLRGWWDRIRELPSKPPMVAYLGFLLLLGAWQPSLADFPRGLIAIGGDPTLLWRGAVIVALYSVVDLFLGYWRTKKWILPSSAWISGFILSLVLAPAAPWSAVLAAPIIASLGKHVVRYRKRHLFNPAALALVVLGFLLPSAGTVSWWGASWGALPLIVIVLSGLVTIVRVKRWRAWSAFSVVYLVGSSLILLSRGASVADLRALVLDGTFWFFSTVMLIEPVTTAYTPAVLRAWFGAAVGILVVLVALVPGLRVPDHFLVSLLLGNLGATLASRALKK